MEALQLHQALVDAGMPSSGAVAKSFFRGLAQRLGIPAAAAATPKQQFFDLSTYLLGNAPSLCSSWLSDYLAVSTTLVSSDPEEAYVLQPEAVLAWAQQAAAGLQQRVGAFLCAGPSARGDAVLELQQTAQALLLVAAAVQTVSSSSAEAQQLVSSLQQLQQATKALQVLEQLQQQQQLPSPGRVTPKGPSGSTPASSSSGARSGLGQQPLFKPCNAACTEWQQRLEQRRQAAAGGRLFLDDLMSALQHAARLPGSSPALTYPYPDVLTCINTLFVSAGGSSGGSSSGSSSSEAWHAKQSLLLYYLLDGGWLGSAEPFAQGFQLPLTLVQQWQCHYLLDAAAAVSGSSSGTGSSMAAAGSTAALDSACHLLGAIACPSTPFRFVEALLAAGRPATALAVQRARCAGGGSSSLSEAEVLLRVQLGCGLLAEAFCDLRRHCGQVPVIKRSRHISSLMRQLADWALSPAPAAAASTTAGGAAAADTTASHMAAQLQLQDNSSHLLLPAGTSSPAAAAAAVAAVTGGGWDACKARQQALLQLPLDASEEGVLVAVLRERMAGGQVGGHLLPLYFLQRGRTLEALSAYADYKASPAAGAASVSEPAPNAAAAAAASAAASRALLHRRLDAVMRAAAAALPPALRSAAAAAGTSSSSSSGAGGVMRSVLQGLGASEARRLQGDQAAEGGSVLLQRRGVEPPAFLAPLLYAAAAAGGGAAEAAAAAAPAVAARGGGGNGGQFSAGALRGGGSSSRRAAGQGAGGNSSMVAGGKEGEGAAAVARPLLFEEEVMAEAGPGTVRLGGNTKGEKGGKNATSGGDVVPLLFGTPALAAAAAATAGGRTPSNVVRGGLFDTPAGVAGAALWAQQTPGGGAAAGGLAGFAGMSEVDFERQVRFATPQPKTAAAGAAAGGVFTHTGKRSHKRMRKTPI